MTNKKQLYESIISSVAKEVKRTLNEYSKYENCDHHHTVNKIFLALTDALNKLDPSYKATYFSKERRDLLKIPYNLRLTRDGKRVGVFVVTRHATNKSGNVQLVNKRRYEPNSLLERDGIDEICIICPPEQNYDKSGSVIDNTKACFFDKQYVINAIENGKLTIKRTAEGETIMFPESWAKSEAKQVIAYKYKK